MTLPRKDLIVGLVITAVLLAWPYLGHSQEYQLDRLEYIFTGIMVAIGLNIVTGFAGQLSLGPGAVYAIGGYAAAVVANDHPIVVGLPLMCLIALVAAAAIGLLIGVPSLRVGGFYLGMTTLFFALVVPTVVSNMKLTGKEQGISLLANIDFRQKIAGIGLYELTLAAVILLLILSWVLLESRTGHRFLTLATSEELASSIGIAPYRTKLLAFLASALPAGIGGAFYVYTQQFISPGSVTPQLSIYLLAACVVGGFGTVLGPYVGGLLVIGLSQYLGGFEQYEGIIFGTLLVAFAVALPEGIMGFDPSVAGISPTWLRALRLPNVAGRRPNAPVRAPEGPPVGVADPSRVVQLMAGGVPQTLRIAGISRSFGGVRALDNVDLAVAPGTVHGLIGSNGSGKTTLLNVVTGYHRPDAGEIRLGNVRLDGRSSHRIAGAGIARTFQTPKLIARGTLVANVAVAAEQQGRRRRDADDVALRCLEAVGLREHAHEKAGIQPHGTRRLVEVARVLAMRPSVVLLDEPAAGLSAAEIEVLGDVLRSIAAAGSAVLLVEHNVPLVLEVADEVTALHEGQRIAIGPPRAVTEHPEVVERVPRFRGRVGVMTARDAAEPALVVEDLAAGYGAITVVEEFSITVDRGELVALLGRNGAGKSTAVSAIAGLRRGSSGTVRVAGRELLRSRPADIYVGGLALVPEGHRVFGALTVRENLRLGAFPWRRKGRNLAAALDRVYALFPILADFAERSAGALSGGQQQMVAIGQALIADPLVLVLDEPSSGLAPAVIDDIYRVLDVLRHDGRAVLVVEQNIDRALRSADRAYVLERGSIALSGPCAELARATAESGRSCAARPPRSSRTSRCREGTAGVFAPVDRPRRDPDGQALRKILIAPCTTNSANTP